ncbi:PREDICTED: cytochrome c oxidase assembly protein COX11, mitochondrial isoform X2 [Gekko japonicus]|uniref:Cytochrome c oxidase assembly protein COX11, mitochondrial isoform X2 n=1 Tax=Gekko japonicus TaxID=146911 RepID=A0ABM1LGE4_GEKJA|nr:PREDICTED: cytochrome c oxidase assembly protein COX11, mitochondrial isoform X2 [Gekko japonicus]
MELCGRVWALLAAKGAAGQWGPWRAWCYLRGNAALGRRRGMSTGRFAGGRQDQQQDWNHRNKTVLTYLAAAVVGMAGVSYAAVPLYRLYCQATGLGGTAVTGHGSDQIETMECIKDRVLKITFNADVHSSLQWNFRPQQTEVYVVPGETALAFYKAKNPTDKPIIGISTYNVVPFEAGQYFNKIQNSDLIPMKKWICRCFSSLILNLLKTQGWPMLT